MKHSVIISREMWICLSTLDDAERLKAYDEIFRQEFEGTGKALVFVPRSPTPQTDAEYAFDDFRRAYPGKRRGFRAEFDNFVKKYPAQWRNILPELMPAVENMIEWSKAAAEAGMFVPCYKNLSTWINNQCWTDEYPPITNSLETKRYHGNSQNIIRPFEAAARRQHDFREHIITKISTPDTPEEDISRNY